MLEAAALDLGTYRQYGVIRCLRKVTSFFPLNFALR